MRFPAQITWSCIWVAIPVDRVILHWYAYGADEPPANYHVFSGMGLRSLALRLRFACASLALRLRFACACSPAMNKDVMALKDVLETLNTRKNTSRRILTGILSKNSENSQLKPKFQL